MFTSENNKKEFIEISDVIKVVQEENNYFFKIIIKVSYTYGLCSL